MKHGKDFYHRCVRTLNDFSFVSAVPQSARAGVLYSETVRAKPPIVSQFLIYAGLVKSSDFEESRRGRKDENNELYGTIPVVLTALRVGLTPNIACAAAGDLMLPRAICL